MIPIFIFSKIIKKQQTIPIRLILPTGYTFIHYFSSLLHVTFISTISQNKFVVIFQESNNYFTQNSLNPA